ncbi:tyrosine-type recombinase/integrase [Streptomyces sp. NPDC059355]|uniref:tyrosine-type recombinase/integrase n=1 Tax=Streptomyces sp. NPDC059355 TaxID=3346811 RepID=UPI0036CF1074
MDALAAHLERFPAPAAYEQARAAWLRSGKPKGGEPARIEAPDGANLHDLRHSYASLLIKHRENVETVQKRLGHAKPSIALDTYTRLWPDEEDTTRAAVEAVLGDVPPLCPARSAWPRPCRSDHLISGSSRTGSRSRGPCP